MIVALSGQVEMKKMAAIGHQKFINIQNTMHNNLKKRLPFLPTQLKEQCESALSGYAETSQVTIPFRNNL